MADQPTLQDFLRNNPGKGLNDYFELYGNVEQAAAAVPSPEQNTPRSYIAPKKKEKLKIDLLNVLASILVLVAFFLPWTNVATFQSAGEWETASGFQLSSMVQALLPTDYTPSSFLTIYLIPIGALVALIGELMRSWAARIIGQILAFSFILYWANRLYHLYEHSGMRPDELSPTQFLQYGFYMVAVAALLYLTDILRAGFGQR